MAQAWRYFDDKTYTEAEYAEVQNRLLAEGVIRNVAGELVAVAAGGSMVVTVSTGEGMIQGFWFKNDAAFNLPAVQPNSSGSTRYDGVYLILNRAANTVTLALVAGVGQNPAPTRTPGGTWTMVLATIAVANGATSIVQGNITDFRGTALCGYTSSGGAVPDGTIALPGASFFGNRYTGFSRDTLAGDSGGIRMSINGGGYYFFDFYGMTHNTFAAAQPGYNIHVHGGAIMVTCPPPPNGAAGIYLGNNATVAAQTMQAQIGLGTAAGHFMGNAGDLNIFTTNYPGVAGAAPGALNLGAATGRYLRIAPGGRVTIGPHGQPDLVAKLNVVSFSTGYGTGFRLYHANGVHNADFYLDASAHFYLNVGYQTQASNSLSIATGSGFVTIGPSVNGSAKFAIVQASSAEAEGMSIILGGGYWHCYSVDEGSAIMRSAGTGVRLWHSQNAFTSTGDVSTNLGTAANRWANVAANTATFNGAVSIGGLTSGHHNPLAKDTYVMGDGDANRWHSIHSLLLYNYSQIISPLVSINQGTNNTSSAGLSITQGGGTTRMWQEGNGSFNIMGPGNPYAHIQFIYGGRSINPAAGVSVDFGSPTAYFRDIYISGNYMTNGAVRPHTNDTGDCGTSLFKWFNMFTVNAAKVGGGSWASVTSDDRAKVAESFRPYESGLDTILALRPIHFRFNGLYTSPNNEKEYVGLRATEVQHIAPDLVIRTMLRAHPYDEDEPEEEILGIDVSNVTYMLINAVQELHGRIEALQAALQERRN